MNVSMLFRPYFLIIDLHSQWMKIVQKSYSSNMLHLRGYMLINVSYMLINMSTKALFVFLLIGKLRGGLLIFKI